MNEMVERVAKSIFEAAMAMHGPTSWEKCNDGQRDNVRRQARAAIEAMRELPGCPGPRYTAGEYSRRTQEAMVDDVLEK